MDHGDGADETRQTGRPPTRIRLAENQMADAKRALVEIESLLASSANKFAELMGIAPRTWRSYKDPDDPGPTPQFVYELDRLVSEKHPDSWSPGDVARQWALDTDAIERDERASPIKRVLIPIVTIGAIGILGVLLWIFASDKPDPSITRSVEVFNKVVLDEEQMQEDTPAYLTSSPDCISFSNCGIDGTSFISGDVLEVACQIRGLEVTNRFGETPNPQNYDSDLWYGMAFGNTFGYISEVWVHEDDRGGLGLRECVPSG